MGISKLRQDLIPYAEEVVLGDATGSSSRSVLPIIRKVVIDGPSLVYYVYSRLYPRSDLVKAGVDVQPSYTEISRGVAEFLATLATSQTDMFDSHSLISHSS